MVDTIGGSIAALLTGFVFLATWGFQKTSFVASCINIGIGLFLFSYFWKTKFKSHNFDSKTINHDPIILLLFFLSGFAALSFEVIWSRYIALIYGSSIYSFSIVLSAFLGGLGIGGFLAGKYADHIHDKITTFAFIELLIGLFGVSLIVLFPNLERVFMHLYFTTNNYFFFQFALFIFCFLLIFIPTILMGMTLPVLSSIYASEKKIASDIGRLFAVNSFGGIFGSFFAGFIIIPAIGLNNASVFTGLIYLLIAITFIFYFSPTFDKKTLKNIYSLSLLLLTFGLVFIVAFHDSSYVFKGVYYHGTRQGNEQKIFETSIEATTQNVFLKNSPYGTVGVYRAWDDSNIWLKNNGKTDASLSDMLTQGMIAHIPLALHENPKNVLNIGMGGAFTLASIMAYAEVEHSDMIEIDPVVVEACKTVLAGFNNYALDDPRSNIIIADGRNFVESTNNKYDIIISEPPNIWVSGVSNLFTKEFYLQAKKKLNPDGIFSQWFPKYEMNEYDYLIALKTIQSAFPYLYEFNLGGDMIIVATLQPIDIYNDINSDRLGQKKVDEDFSYIIYHSNDDEYNFPEGNYSASERNTNYILSYFARDYTMIDKQIKDITLINTDDLPILEFSTLRNKYPKFRS